MSHLTLQATALEQVPKTAPESVPIAGSPDGTRAGEIQLDATDSGAVGHLTSPVLNLTPCQVYTLSVYARSDESTARLQLGLWTAPVDFSRPPDTLSYTFPLTSE